MASTMASPRSAHVSGSAIQAPVSAHVSTQGVYILGDDAVLRHMQVVAAALANQLSTQEIQICIIPFSEQMAATRVWIDQQPHISLFEDVHSIHRWETFYEAVWMSQPVAHRLSERYARDHGQVNYARKFCAFDGSFQAFVVYDAVRGVVPQKSSPKSLSSNFTVPDFTRLNLPEFLSQLDRYDLIVEDWEWLKPTPSAVIDMNYLQQSEQGQPQDQAFRHRLHGAQFFAAKAQLLSPELLTQLFHNLIDRGETRWLNTLRWWDEAALFSYMTLRLDAHVLNRTRAQASGCPLLALEQALDAVQHYVLAEQP